MEVRIKLIVHADDHCRWTLLGKHSNQNEVSVMNPFEIWIRPDVESLIFEHRHAPFAILKIRFKLVVHVFARMDICDGRFPWLQVHRNFDHVT